MPEQADNKKNADKTVINFLNILLPTRPTFHRAQKGRRELHNSSILRYTPNKWFRFYRHRLPQGPEIKGVVRAC